MGGLANKDEKRWQMEKTEVELDKPERAKNTDKKREVLRGGRERGRQLWPTGNKSKISTRAGVIRKKVPTKVLYWL